MSENSKLASDIQPFKSRWRLNWPFWWVGVLQSGALSCACFSQIIAPLAVSVRPHTPNCRASGRQRQHADQKTHSPSARRMKVSRVPRVLLEVLIGRALLEVLIGRQQLSAV